MTKEKMAVCLHGGLRTFPYTKKWILQQYEDFDVDFFLLLTSEEDLARTDLFGDLNAKVVKLRPTPNSTLNLPIPTFNIIQAIASQQAYAFKNEVKYSRVAVQRFDCIGGPHYKCASMIKHRPNSIATTLIPTLSCKGEGGDFPFYTDINISFDNIGATNFFTASINLLNQPATQMLLFHGAFAKILQMAGLHLINTKDYYMTHIIRPEHTLFMNTNEEIQYRWWDFRINYD